MSPDRLWARTNLHDVVSRRALVLSTGRDRGALAGIRALAASGWQVGVGTPDGQGMVTASSACTRSYVVPRPRGDHSAFVEGMREAVEDGAYDVVFGGGDDWMAALSAHRTEIPAIVAHPDSTAVHQALNKTVLTARALEVGLTAPVTHPATDETMSDWDGPVVVKCREHWSPGQTRPHRIDARLFPDIFAAAGRVTHIRSMGADPVLQQPIEGTLMAVVGVFRQGRLTGRVQQHSARLWPTPSGMSARAVTVPVDAQLAEGCERLLSRIGWSGLVELQFIADRRGTPHLLDLNGRFYGSLALAEAARPGLVAAWAELVTGGELVDLPDGRPGLRYTWLAGDLRRAVQERRGGLVADVAGTLRWSIGARHSVFAVSDLGPTARLAGERLTGTPVTPVHQPVPVG